MHIQINDIIKYYAQTTIRFKDLFQNKLFPDVHDTNRKTAARFSGVVVTLSGSCQFSLNDSIYKLQSGIILHAGPSMEIDIYVTSEDPWEYVVIHYEPTISQKFSVNSFSIEVGEHHKIEYFTKELIEVDKIPGDLNQIRCRSLFLQLIEQILVCAKLQKEGDVIDYAISYMKANFAEPISIKEISEHIGCDRRKLAYRFEKQIGMSPIQFLTELRMKKSCELLRTTKCPIKEITQLVGYQDQFYFSRVFKKHYDVTPTQYRETY